MQLTTIWDFFVDRNFDDYIICFIDEGKYKIDIIVPFQYGRYSRELIKALIIYQSVS